jgi:choline dehydrogenase-like flavoprotein
MADAPGETFDYVVVGSGAGGGTVAARLHASCTCAIGPKDQSGVLTSDFRVHGTQGLRVVDASVFPRIPGFFIVCPIYMIAEKAADDILTAAE